MIEFATSGDTPVPYLFLCGEAEEASEHRQAARSYCDGYSTSLKPPRPSPCSLQNTRFAFRKVRSSDGFHRCSQSRVTFSHLPPPPPGITGGFAPPIPDAIYTFAYTPSMPAIAVTVALRPDGTPVIASASPKSLTADSASTSLVDQLYDLLHEIPARAPSGADDDIYGLDTGIAWNSNDGFEWSNSAPEGCVQSFPPVRAPEDQKSKFKQAVGIVEELVGKAT